MTGIWGGVSGGPKKLGSNIPELWNIFSILSKDYGVFDIQTWTQQEGGKLWWICNTFDLNKLKTTQKVIDGANEIFSF